MCGRARRNVTIPLIPVQPFSMLDPFTEEDAPDEHVIHRAHSHALPPPPTCPSTLASPSPCPLTPLLACASDANQPTPHERGIICPRALCVTDFSCLCPLPLVLSPHRSRLPMHHPRQDAAAFCGAITYYRLDAGDCRAEKGEMIKADAANEENSERGQEGAAAAAAAAAAGMFIQS